MQECNKTIQKMINFDDVTKENIKEYNPNWPKIHDHPCRVLTVGCYASDNPLHFRKNLLERIQKLIMTINNKILDKKLQYDINWEASKIPALNCGKIDKYEYLTGKEIIPSGPSQIIQQAKFTYSPWGKAFEKQIENRFAIWNL